MSKRVREEGEILLDQSQKAKRVEERKEEVWRSIEAVLCSSGR